MKLDINTYQERASKFGEFIPVWNNNSEEYEQVDMGTFMSNYEKGTQTYAHSNPRGYLYSPEGKVVNTGTADFYNYLKAGYRPLDPEIAEAISKPTEDLTRTGVRAILPKGRVGTGIGSFLKQMSHGTTFGFDQALLGKDDRFEQIEEEELKDRYSGASALGSTAGFIGSLGSGFGVGKALGLAKGGEKLAKLGAKAGTLGKYSAEAAAWTLPFAVSTAIGEKDIKAGAETLLWGSLLGGGIATGGQFTGKVLSTAARGASNLTRSVSSWLNRSWYSHRNTKTSQDFLSKKGPVLKDLMSDTRTQNFAHYAEELPKILTKDQKIKIFKKVDDITPEMIAKKTEKIWETATPSQKLAINTEMGRSGGSYEKSFIEKQELIGQKKNILESVRDRVRDIQKPLIARNQQIKHTLKTSDFIDKIYSSSDDVLVKSMRKAKDVSTGHIKKNLNRLKKEIPANSDEFDKFSGQVLHWLTRNDNALKRLNTKGHKKFVQDDVIDFLSSKGFADDEAGLVIGLYDDIVRANPKAVEIAVDVNTAQMVANKKGNLTNAEVDFISHISGKYKNAKNPFNKKVFAPTVKEADRVSMDLFKDKNAVVSKQEMVQQVNSVFKDFNKYASSLGGRKLNLEKTKLINALDNVFGDRKFVDISEVGNFQEGIRQITPVFTDKTGIQIKGIYDKFLNKLSDLENSKIDSVLNNVGIKKLLKPEEVSKLSAFKLRKKEISSTLFDIDEISTASGSDISAFILKDPLMSVATLGGIAALGFGVSGAPLAATIGGSTLLAFMATQALKQGKGLIGASHIARNTYTAIDDSANYLNKLAGPKFFLNQISGSSRLSQSFAKFTGFTIGNISESLFGKKIKEPMDLQVALQTSIQNVTSLPNESSVSLATGMLQDTGTGTADLMTAMAITQQEVMKTLSENLGYIAPDDPEKKEKISEFEKDVEVLFDPQAIMKHLKKKTFTPRMGQNFKKTYPATWNKVRMSLIEDHLKKNFTNRVDYDKLLLLSTLFEFDFTGLKGGYNVPENYNKMSNVGREYRRKVKTAEDQLTQTQKIQQL